VRYLLVNHLAFGRGSAPGLYTARDVWVEDLRAQQEAVSRAGMQLVVASPLTDVIEPNGASAVIEIDPKAAGFEHVALPCYQSFGQYLSVRHQLRTTLREAMRDASIVQCGYGGHPVPLGQVAWPLAGAAGKKRIWVFDGGDPFPQWEFHARTIRNPIKRMARLAQLRRFEQFCAKAVAEADLVFAHNSSVVDRFKNSWHAGCHQFHRSFVTPELLIDEQHLARRQQALRDRSKPLKLIAAGRQIAIKGTDHVLRALAAARKRGADVELDVLGEGEDLARFKQLAQDLGLDGAVRFHNAVPYGPRLFEEWESRHCLIVTNLTSEFSRNLLLGMARGLPLITYDNPGDGVIAPNNAGIIVPKGDEAALAKAIYDAWDDREQLAQLAAVALPIAGRTTLQMTHKRRAELAVGLAGPPPQQQEPQQQNEPGHTAVAQG
jgi:glycosyltransferase involved in cell wall biosynthesis